MKWRAEGILLSKRHLGESAAIITAFTEEYGRHSGVVYGGASRRMAPILQLGEQLDLSWRARVEQHIGTFGVETIRSRAATAMSGRLSLAGLKAVAALLDFALPEREPYSALYRHTEKLLDLLGQDSVWPFAYLRWEMKLLEETGFGLDLEKCAITGRTDGLNYVSPKSGRAVTSEGAGHWVSQLLPLPSCLRGEEPESILDVITALHTTGYFLKTKMAPMLGNKPLPEDRQFLLSILTKLE